MIVKTSVVRLYLTGWGYFEEEEKLGR